MLDCFGFEGAARFLVVAGLLSAALLPEFDPLAPSLTSSFKIFGVLVLKLWTVLPPKRVAAACQSICEVDQCLLSQTNVTNSTAYLKLVVTGYKHDNQLDLFYPT